MRHEEMTRTIIGCAMDVSNELGAGFLESVYERALMIVLQEKGVSVQRQHRIDVHFREIVVGEFFADLFVDESVIVELKAARGIAPEHEAQIINYLKATRVEVGLILNFGQPKLEFKRYTRTPDSGADRNSMDVQD